MVFLDQHGKQKGGQQSLESLDAAGIETLLEKKGITQSSPKPKFKERKFPHTQHCKAWRQTGDCKSTGTREVVGDAPCTEQFAGRASGYCECTDKRRLNFNCEDAGLHRAVRKHARRSTGISEQRLPPPGLYACPTVSTRRTFIPTRSGFRHLKR